MTRISESPTIESRYIARKKKRQIQDARQAKLVERNTLERQEKLKNEANRDAWTD